MFGKLLRCHVPAWLPKAAKHAAAAVNKAIDGHLAAREAFAAEAAAAGCLSAVRGAEIALLRDELTLRRDIADALDVLRRAACGMLPEATAAAARAKSEAVDRLVAAGVRRSAILQAQASGCPEVRDALDTAREIRAFGGICRARLDANTVGQAVATGRLETLVALERREHGALAARKGPRRATYSDAGSRGGGLRGMRGVS